MLTRIAFVVEIIAIIVGLYRIYGRKFRIDISLIVFTLVSLVVQETIALLGINEINTIIFNMVLFVYCKLHFKESLLQTGVGIFFLSILITICQFVCAVVTCVLLPEAEQIRPILINVGVLSFNLWMLPRFKLDILKKNIDLKHRYTILIAGIVGGVIVLLLLQSKVLKWISADLFIFLLPVLITMIFIFIKWNSSQELIHQMECERENELRMQTCYEELLKEVRMRQHAFKNHIAAIFSTHYTYKTYEQLVRAQEEYCNRIREENKYNHLLLISNKLLVGFLYEKFQEIEKDGIHLEYKIATNLENLRIPIYRFIEIIGILIDNAVEALKEVTNKNIVIEIGENEKEYYFLIRNRGNYVSYSQMSEWFEFEYSSKGGGRGIGLHHAKALCEELNCDIVCENVNIKNENWIKFTVLIQKADNHQN